jgi:hypothetical protein
MINVSAYWTLPPSRQGKIRAKIDKEEQQKIVGYYHREKWGDCVEFTLYCSKCYHDVESMLEEDEVFSPLTNGAYRNPRHEMHGEKCEECNKSLA